MHLLPPSIAFALLFAPVLAFAQGQPTIQQLLSKSQIVVADEELSMPFDYVALSDGSVVAVEFQSTTITRYTSDGTRRWKVGRAGSGPGEFRVPYRLAVRPDQSVLVFDVGTQLVTQIDSAGLVQATYRPDMQIAVNSAIVTPAGDVLIAGTTQDPRGRAHSLHLFSATMKHKQSFAERSSVIDERFDRVVGPGTLRVNEQLGFFHTRGYPYEMVQYTWSFKELARVKVPAEIDPPESWVAYSTTSDGRSVMRSNKEARRPMSVQRIGSDLYLGGVLSETTTLILFDGRGRLLDKTPQPNIWSSIATFDRARRQLWVYGERDDEPVLLRYDLAR